MMLAGDVGGTKTLLSFFEIRDDQLVELKRKKYASNDYESLEIILTDFLSDVNGKIESAAFGVPGPVIDGKAKPTNLKWSLDAKKISSQFNIPIVNFLNDLSAAAFAVPYLTKTEIIEIKKGSEKLLSERFTVIAPGTGLGEAFLICENGKKIVLSSEGGHSDFAPTNEMEAELFKYLNKKFGRVSYERIISGSGLPNVFDFLVDCKYGVPENKTLERMKTEDRAVVISEMALNKNDKVCEDALEIFVSVLGAHSSNCVLTNLTTGGVYLGGGIPFKILPMLQGKIFLNSFLNKGRLSSLIEATPIYLINNNNAALIGAAWYAVNSKK
ncbi:glucokinase [Ignavibacterium sp.]|uniref:glucokinase n=1 Tax=Ignavibacterium sp. TaxID=2651167 RepID=UPI00307FC49E